MSALLSLFWGAWGRVVAVVVGIVAIIAAVLTVRANIRSSAQREMSEAIQRRTIDQLKEAKHAQDDAASVPDDSIHERLRDMGYLRDGD